MDINQINEGLRLEEECTPGPWTDPYGSMWEDNPLKVHSAGVFFGKTGLSVNFYSPHDAALVRFLRTNARELLECARRCGEMEKEIERLREFEWKYKDLCK